MGLNVTVLVTKNLQTKRGYRAQFLVDSGAIDSMAPASELRKAGIKPVGKMTYELADGSRRAFRFGSATFQFMGDIAFGRILFGDEGVEPLLGVTVLESVGILVDPATKKLRRLAAIPLKICQPKVNVVAMRPRR
jgi:clan AA aspartic protease